MIMITPLPGVTPTKPGTATLPFFGVDAAIVDRSGKELGPNQGGLLVDPQALAGDAARHLQRPRALREAVLDATCPACYFTGDGARRDEDGYFWIMGRVDDVINVSATAWARWRSKARWSPTRPWPRRRCVGMPHEMKGQGIAASSRSKPAASPARS